MSKPKSTQRELCPEGEHASVCLGVIDLGTQESTFKGKTSKKRKLYITFEPQGVEKEEGGRFEVVYRITNSTHESSNLAKTLKKWLGIKDIADYDLEQLAGKPAMITVEHNNDFANITEIDKLPSGKKVAKPEAKLKSLFLDETFDAAVFESLNDRIKEKIMQSPEYDAVLASQKKGAKAKGKKK